MPELNIFPKRKNGPILCDLQGELKISYKKGKKALVRKIYVLYAKGGGLKQKKKIDFHYKDIKKDGTLCDETKIVSHDKLMKLIGK